ncbi:MAG: putative DNA-binding transcriptional regulator [Firmicutes bacterium ADurb.Bin193]|nr:MAG: putative DNA-binding transcriptional regulator [Firmicutes bacterium ADurb.Bin193]
MQATSMYGDLIVGTFIKEEKNRFICRVRVSGIETVCYIPSSCRLSNFIDLEGRQVLLKPNASRKTRTEYSVFAVKYKRGFIPVNLSLANRVVEEQIKNRRFSFLGNRKNVIREAMIDGYKADLYISDTQTIIEIKSILSFEKETVFPTVYSERALNQLIKIKELLLQGYTVHYMLISLNPVVKQITLNQNMSDFYEHFLECIALGMQCCGYSIYLQSGIPTTHSKTNVYWC